MENFYEVVTNRYDEFMKEKQNFEVISKIKPFSNLMLMSAYS